MLMRAELLRAEPESGAQEQSGADSARPGLWAEQSLECFFRGCSRGFSTNAIISTGLARVPFSGTLSPSRLR